MGYEADGEKQAIYSPIALFWFSVVFGLLAGGIMAFQSLRAVGQVSSARYTLWLSIGGFMLCWLSGYLLPYPVLADVVVGTAWGAGFWYTVRKRVPDEASLPRRSIATPLRVCLYIVAAFIILACIGIQLG